MHNLNINFSGGYASGPPILYRPSQTSIDDPAACFVTSLESSTLQ